MERKYVISRNYDRNPYLKNLSIKVNPILKDNFNKICDWIKLNYPKLNGVFQCKHNPYYNLKLVVDDGNATLECGSWGYNYFQVAVSKNFTETLSQGSCQHIPIRYENIFAFDNSKLEEFLSQWYTIKNMIIEKGSIQNNVYSKDFVA